jgi:hypothetical protein
MAVTSLVAPAVVKRYPAKILFIIAAITYVIFILAQVWGMCIPVAIMLDSREQYIFFFSSEFN